MKLRLIVWTTVLLAFAAIAVAVAVPQNYARSQANVFLHEGGYANHPRDPGGATNFGITIYDVRKYIKADATPADVRALKKEQAAEIYRSRYWDTIRGDELPLGIDYTLFDYGIHSGPARARMVMRRVMNMEGVQVPFTNRELGIIREQCAIDKCATLIVAINAERHAFLRRLTTWPVFGVGWNRRVNFVTVVSLRMSGTVSRADLGGGAIPQRSFGRGIEGPGDFND